MHLARNHTRRVSPEQLTEAVAALDRSWMRRTERDLYWSSVDTDDGVIHGLGAPYGLVGGLRVPDMRVRDRSMGRH